MKVLVEVLVDENHHKWYEISYAGSVYEYHVDIRNLFELIEDGDEDFIRTVRDLGKCYSLDEACKMILEYNSVEI